MRTRPKLLGAIFVSSLSAATAGCGGPGSADTAVPKDFEPAAGSDAGGGPVAPSAGSTGAGAGSDASSGADGSGVVTGIGASAPFIGAGPCSVGGSAMPCVIDAVGPGTPLTCPGHQCSVLGTTGPEVAITDQWEGGTSSATLAEDQACISGETAAWAAATWGAMLTFNLGPAVDSTGDASVPGLPAAVAAPVPLDGSGIDVRVSFSSGGTPAAQELLLVVFVADADTGTWYANEYCAKLPATEGLVRVPWASLTYQCWQPGNPALSGPPRAGVVGIQVSAVDPSTVADEYHLCVDQLSIAP